MRLEHTWEHTWLGVDRRGSLINHQAVHGDGSPGTWPLTIKTHTEAEQLDLAQKKKKTSTGLQGDPQAAGGEEQRAGKRPGMPGVDVELSGGVLGL